METLTDGVGDGGGVVGDKDSLAGHSFVWIDGTGRPCTVHFPKHPLEEMFAYEHPSHRGEDERGL